MRSLEISFTLQIFSQRFEWICSFFHGGLRSNRKRILDLQKPQKRKRHHPSVVYTYSHQIVCQLSIISHFNYISIIGLICSRPTLDFFFFQVLFFLRFKVYSLKNQDVIIMKLFLHFIICILYMYILEEVLIFHFKKYLYVMIKIFIAQFLKQQVQICTTYCNIYKLRLHENSHYSCRNIYT